MKTIFKNGTYLRVSDEVAEKEFQSGTATYASKSEWKRNVRDALTVKEKIDADVKSETKEKKLKKALKLKNKQESKK